MKFQFAKKILFTNNKGGVGKTTLAYNCAFGLASKGYKVCLIDLDPQSNLTRLALGEEHNNKTIYDVLQGLIDGGSDIDDSIPPIRISTDATEECYLIPGDLRLSVFESGLQTPILEARSGQARGFLYTSAISRYVDSIARKERFDIIICDSSPSLGILNYLIFLSFDYFIVPMMLDTFSVQGIENLGRVYEDWKNDWRSTAGYAKEKKISADRVLNGRPLFLGYIINGYNIRNDAPIRDEQKWLEAIPEKVKNSLSKHADNGLVELSWKIKLGMLKDVGKISPLAQRKSKPISQVTRQDIGNRQQGTMKSQAKAIIELNAICDEIDKRLQKY